MESTFLQLMNNRFIEAIGLRRAVRTYSGKPIAVETKEGIRHILGELSGPFEGKVRCGLIDKKDAAAKDGVKLGTYGVILGASLFIAGAAGPGSQAMEQLGYVFEQAVLYLTSQGLGTCWLAGTFRRSAFAAAMYLRQDEMLPVISPVGYPSRIRGPVDMLFKPSLARRRLPWQRLFFDGDFGTPLDGTTAGSFAVPLEMVRLAPSASNKQPWRVLRRNRSFLFFLDGNRAYRRMYEFDIQKIDMGIALLHFEAAARELGLPGHWENPSAQHTAPSKTWEHIMTWVAE
ncbi:MAG: nitroreductase family protein [Syntrophorhabdales bacterium]|jgi:nitroreductase